MGIARDTDDAHSVLRSVSHTLGALGEDEPSVGSVARAAGTDILNTATGVTGKVAGSLAMNTLVQRGASEAAAKVVGSAAGGVIAVGFELGKLAMQDEQPSSSDVAKAVTKAAVTGLLCLVATPLVGVAIGMAAGAAVDRLVDAAMGD
jgi:hypothetical protein